MTVAVRSVTFNHEPGNPAVSAMNVRRNANELAVLPEWQAGVTTTPEESVAAYVIEAVHPLELLIEATFLSSDPALTKAEVRAVEFPATAFPAEIVLPSVPPAVAAAGTTTDWLVAVQLAWQDWVADGGNVLGEVAEQLVNFDAGGNSGPVKLSLVNVRLASGGCSANNVFWRWQFRVSPADPWQEAGVTQHRIYATLGLPTLPWTLDPFEPANTQLPWTEVLEHACTWAAGRNTREGILAGVTVAVFLLGQPPKKGIIEYGCPIGAVTMYAQQFFNCSAFLDRLRGGIGNGRYVNCTDCAAFVATFANILGCDLWESRMGEYSPPFACNPFLAIGTGVWNVPCGVPAGFRYHEVPWSGACDSDAAVCDACIAFSGLTTFPPPGQTPVFAVLTRFGLPGEGGYRDVIAAPAARDICRPLPAERVRRSVF